MIFKVVITDLREHLEKKTSCGEQDISGLDHLKSKNQKDLVNIRYYLVFNRRNKQNINFLQNGGFSKKNFDFL